MRMLKRNLRAFTYCPFVSSARNGLSMVMTYGEPVTAFGNISPATGSVSSKIFGADIVYDKVLLLDDPDLPIDEHSILFIDKGYEVDAETGVPLYDYVVKRIAKSLNHTAVAVKRVSVS